MDLLEGYIATLGEVFNLTPAVAMADHGSAVRWTSYRRLAIKRHPKGLVLVANLYGGSQSHDPYFSCFVNPDNPHLPYWLGTVDVVGRDYLLSLPDFEVEVMEPEISLDEIHAFQDLVEGR